MKINSDLLIDSKVNGTFYANDFKCKNMLQSGVRQGNTVDTGASNRLFTLYSVKVEKGKTYAVSTNLNISNFQYAIRVASNPFPTSNTFYSGSWITTTSETWTATSNGYLGILIAKTDLNASITPSDISNTYFQVEEGNEATTYTPYKAFENDETLRDIKTFSNEGIYWDKAINYETAADVPQWYELITLTLKPQKTGVYLINYSIPVLAKAGGTPFLDFQLDGARKNRAYISNVSSYTSMNAMAITGSFTLSGISLNQSHSLVIGISKNNSIGYKVSAGYPITVTVLEI